MKPLRKREESKEVEQSKEEQAQSFKRMQRPHS